MVVVRQGHLAYKLSSKAQEKEFHKGRVNTRRVQWTAMSAPAGMQVDKGFVEKPMRVGFEGGDPLGGGGKGRLGRSP